MNAPRFPHDCGACRFLGHMTVSGGQPLDAYACWQGGTQPTIILRWGPGGDYTSGVGMFAALTPELRDAARRWLVEDPDIALILDTLREAGGELPFEQLEHRYYQRGGS